MEPSRALVAQLQMGPIHGERVQSLRLSMVSLSLFCLPVLDLASTGSLDFSPMSCACLLCAGPGLAPPMLVSTSWPPDRSLVIALRECSSLICDQPRPLALRDSYSLARCSQGPSAQPGVWSWKPRSHPPSVFPSAFKNTRSRPNCITSYLRRTPE